MKNPEMGGMPPTPKEEKPRYVVGAKKNPDGSIDYSRAATWSGPKSGEQKEQTTEFQQDVKAIMKHLDNLDELLDPEKLRPGWGQLGTHLNQNVTGITAFKRVLSEVSPEEYNVLVQKAGQIEDKMEQALNKVKDAKLKREQGEGGEYIDEGVFIWLEKEGPAVMESLKELRDIVQE